MYTRGVYFYNYLTYNLYTADHPFVVINDKYVILMNNTLFRMKCLANYWQFENYAMPC